ncbi:MAG: MTH938/NDUFAF3 family protein [Chloroflexota bacterium]|nr:MTH938/NDUFAF3 family protein [Chloroflexota bacterium]
MERVESLSFGSIVVGGKKYRRDLLLFPDGTVKQRKGGFWIFGSHDINKDEVDELVRAGADEIVIGIGTSSGAKVSDDAKAHVEQAQRQLYILPSHEAFPEFNRLSDLGKKVAALIHITC